MAPAASTTDVCRYRAAHPALAVRHVHVTPAAERARHLKPIAPNANRARGAGRAINTASRRRAMGGRAQRRGAHTRGIAIRWNRTNPHIRSHWHTYTHAHARARTREHRHNHAHERTRKRTCALHAHAHCTTRTRTEDPRRGPSTPSVSPKYPLSIPLVPPKYLLSIP